MKAHGKLILSEDRVPVPVSEARVAGITILKKAGCSEEVCQEIVEHLLDADLSGVRIPRDHAGTRNIMMNFKVVT